MNGHIKTLKWDFFGVGKDFGRECSALPENRITLLDLPDSLLLLICRKYLLLREWRALSMQCRRLNSLIEALWLEKHSLVVDCDVANIAAQQMRFYISEDNVWPQRLYKSDSLISLATLLEFYKGLDSLLLKCRRLRSIQLISSNVERNERKSVGRSFFRLLGQFLMCRLTYLDLSSSMFMLQNFLECCLSFPELKEIRVDNCMIYISRRDISSSENCRKLQPMIRDFPKLRHRMSLGVKVLLVKLAEAFPLLEQVHCSCTEFQSTGCIVYGYGTEPPDASYELENTSQVTMCCKCL